MGRWRGKYVHLRKFGRSFSIIFTRCEIWFQGLSLLMPGKSILDVARYKISHLEDIGVGQFSMFSPDGKYPRRVGISRGRCDGANIATLEDIGLSSVSFSPVYDPS